MKPKAPVSPPHPWLLVFALLSSSPPSHLLFTCLPTLLPLLLSSHLSSPPPHTSPLLILAPYAQTSLLVSTKILTSLLTSPLPTLLNLTAPLFSSHSLSHAPSLSLTQTPPSPPHSRSLVLSLSRTLSPTLTHSRARTPTHACARTSTRTHRPILGAGGLGGITQGGPIRQEDMANAVRYSNHENTGHDQGWAGWTKGGVQRGVFEKG